MTDELEQARFEQFLVDEGCIPPFTRGSVLSAIRTKDIAAKWLAEDTPPTSKGELMTDEIERARISPQMESEIRHLMKVAIRSAWCYEHGLRIGRDDATELSVYVQRLAMLMGWLPLNCNAAQSRKFQEEISGLTFDEYALPSRGDAPVAELITVFDSARNRTEEFACVNVGEETGYRAPEGIVVKSRVPLYTSRGDAGTPPQSIMNDDQIKYMVSRFLGWRLPEHFNPDAGISFKPNFNEHTAHPMKHEPIGTNLFDATQAEDMVRYLVDGMPKAEAALAHREAPPLQKIIDVIENEPLGYRTEDEHAKLENFADRCIAKILQLSVADREATQDTQRLTEMQVALGKLKDAESAWQAEREQWKAWRDEIAASVSCGNFASIYKLLASGPQPLPPSTSKENEK